MTNLSDAADSSRNWFETRFYVRYAETDQMGIVHHSHYIVWAEEGRSALLRTLGASYSKFEAGGYYLAVSHVNARYIASAHYDQLITVRTRLAQIKSRVIKFEYEVVDTQTRQLLATLQTAHVCVDHNGNVATIPSAWRQHLKATTTETI